jgi:hypothetical protein
VSLWEETRVFFPFLSFSFSLSPHPPLLNYTMTQREGSYLQARKRPSPEPDKAGTLILDFPTSRNKKMIVYYFKSPVCGILFWQRRVMNAASFQEWWPCLWGQT